MPESGIWIALVPFRMRALFKSLVFSMLLMVCFTGHAAVFQGEGYYWRLNTLNTYTIPQLLTYLGTDRGQLQAANQGKSFERSTLRAFAEAAAAFATVNSNYQDVRQNFLIVTDYTLRGGRPRLWTFEKKLIGQQMVIDIYQFHVAHGGGPRQGHVYRDPLANNFYYMREASSRMGTGLSSPGAYLTLNYDVSPSLGPIYKLEGIEPQLAAGYGLSGNSRAYDRLIYIHEDRVVNYPASILGNLDIAGIDYLQPTMGCFGVSELGRQHLIGYYNANSEFIRNGKLAESTQKTFIYSFWNIVVQQQNEAAGR